MVGQKKNVKKNAITKEMTFVEIMDRDPDAAFKLMEMGMMCGGCPMAGFETLEDGCTAHGEDIEDVINKLNKNGKRAPLGVPNVTREPETQVSKNSELGGKNGKRRS